MGQPVQHVGREPTEGLRQNRVVVGKRRSWAGRGVSGGRSGFVATTLGRGQARQQCQRRPEPREPRNTLYRKLEKNSRGRERHPGDAELALEPSWVEAARSHEDELVIGKARPNEHADGVALEPDLRDEARARAAVDGR